MTNYFQLTYFDESNYIGQLLKGHDWMKSPEKKIVRLEYFLGNKKLTLEGFKQYIQVYEQVAFGRTGITKTVVVGRRETDSVKFVFDFRTLKVIKEFCPIGMEYNGMVISGWKDGLLNKPKYKLEGRNV